MLEAMCLDMCRPNFHPAMPWIIHFLSVTIISIIRDEFNSPCRNIVLLFARVYGTLVVVVAGDDDVFADVVLGASIPARLRDKASPVLFPWTRSLGVIACIFLNDVYDFLIVRD